MKLKPILMNNWTPSMHAFSQRVSKLDYPNTNLIFKECPEDIGYFIEQGEFDNNPFVYFFNIKK